MKCGSGDLRSPKYFSFKLIRWSGGIIGCFAKLAWHHRNNSSRLQARIPLISTYCGGGGYLPDINFLSDLLSPTI